MPIHDQGYRHYVGQRAPHGRAWWVIARSQIMTALQTRPFRLLLIAAWAPVVVRAVMIYISSNNLPVPEFIATTPQTFRDFLGQQQLFVFMVTIGQAGLIAEDRRTNALQLYLSKPLTRVEYIIGKLVPPLVYVLFVTAGAGPAAAPAADHLRGKPGLPAREFLPVAGHHALLADPGAARRVRDPGAVVAHQEPSLCLDHVRGVVFFSYAMYQVLRGITTQPHLGSDFTGWRCSTSSPMPPSAAGESRPCRSTWP